MKECATKPYCSNYKFLFTFVFLIFKFIYLNQANAIEVEKLNVDSPHIGGELSGVGNKEYSCHYRISGDINVGDSINFQNIIEDGALICLDSNGGSIAEAIKIIDYIQKHGIGTRIEKGATCASACAWIFMAGTQSLFPVGDFPFRQLDKDGKLRFHGPDIVVADRIYNSADIKKVFSVSSEMFAKLADKIISKKNNDGNSWVKPSLFIKTLGVPFSEYYEIQNIDDLGMWQIELLSGVNVKKLNKEQAYNICTNLISWHLDKRSSDYINEVGKEGFIGPTEFKEKVPWRSGVEEEGWILYREGMYPDECRIYKAVDNEFANFNAEIKLNGSSSTYFYGVTDYYTIPGDIKISTYLNKKSAHFERNQDEITVKNSVYCKVIGEDYRTIDSEECQEESLTQDGRLIRKYRWPSGAVTVVEELGGSYRINGVYTTIKKGVDGLCYLNSTTGNKFCIVK